MNRFEGQTAIITGAASGIGRAIALRLAREGCNIGVFDIDADGAAGTAAMVRAEGRTCAVALGSVSDRDAVMKGAQDLTEELGAIDILVNNAGILRTAKFLNTTEASWRATLGVNLDGVFHFCQAILPAMLARRRGNIVNMSSWTGKKGVPSLAAYSASKFAVIGLTQSIAGEVAEHGIRVNAVCPGIIVDTGMRVEAGSAECRARAPRSGNAHPHRTAARAGEPDEIAKVVAFLASDDASYMTGQAINITGGLWMN